MKKTIFHLALLLFLLVTGRSSGESGETEFQSKFTDDQFEVTVQQLVFGGEAIGLEGSR